MKVIRGGNRLRNQVCIDLTCRFDMVNHGLRLIFKKRGL